MRKIRVLGLLTTLFINLCATLPESSDYTTPTTGVSSNFLDIKPVASGSGTDGASTVFVSSYIQLSETDATEKIYFRFSVVLTDDTSGSESDGYFDITINPYGGNIKIDSGQGTPITTSILTTTGNLLRIEFDCTSNERINYKIYSYVASPDSFSLRANSYFDLTATGIEHTGKTVDRWKNFTIHNDSLEDHARYAWLRIKPSLAHASIGMEPLSLADFTTGADTYEASLSSMSASELKSINQTVVEAELEYNRLASGDLTSADSIVTDVLATASAETTKQNFDFQAYKDSMPSMSTTDLNALTLSSLRTHFDTASFTADIQTIADTYLNEILAYRDALVATAPSLTWSSIDGEASTNKQATLGSRTFYFRPHDQFVHTGSVSTSSGGLTSTQPGAPNYHWHYDLASGSPLSSDMSSFIIGGCAALDCSTEIYNYGYNLLYQDYQDATRWGHEAWTDNDVTPHQRTSMSWRYDPTNLTWEKGILHTSENSVGDFSLYEPYENNWFHKWVYNPSTKVWSHTVRQSVASETGSQTIEWKYDDNTQRWANLSFGEVWEHSDTHVWEQVGAKERRWYYRHGLNPAFIMNLDAYPDIDHAGEFDTYHLSAIRSGFISLGSQAWYEQETTDDLVIADRVSGAFTRNDQFVWSGGSGGKRGQFEDDASNVYSYDVDGIWNRTSGSSGDATIKFPPFLPPMPVVQHQNIITVFESLVDAGLWTAPASSLSWTDLGSTNYVAHVAKQRTYKYKSSTTYSSSSSINSLTGQFVGTFPTGKWAFDTSGGSPLANVELSDWTFLTNSYEAQRWSIMTTDFTPVKPRDTVYGFVFDKATQSFAPMNWSSGAGSTARKSIAEWQYSAPLKKWTNQGMGETWTYNTASKRWTSVTPGYDGADDFTQEWSYDHDTKVWTNHTFDETWTAHSPVHFSNGKTEWYNHAYSGMVWGNELKGSTSSYILPTYFVYTSTPGYYLRHSGWATSATTDYRVMFQDNDITDPSTGYYYRGPSGSNVRGTWELSSPSTTYSSYDETADAWAHPTSGDDTFFFPHLPPIPVSVHQDMISVYESLNSAGYATTIVDITPTTWTADSRDHSYHKDIAYDTTESTAPLKITTADSQLLHDLTKNPNFTQLGKWQFKDTTNSHTWSFNPTTGVWSNAASGYSWKFSKNTAGQWIQESVNISWVFDENSQTWKQIVSEAT